MRYLLLIWESYVYLSMLGYIVLASLYIYGGFGSKEINAPTWLCIWGHWLCIQLVLFYRFGVAKFNGKTYNENGCKMFWKED